MTSAQKKLSYMMSRYSGPDLEQHIQNSFEIDELMELVGSDLMSFDGLQRGNSGRVVDLILVGGATTDTIYINPDHRTYEADNGHPVSNKGIAGNTITATTSPGDTKKLFRWLDKTPSNCMKIVVTTADVTQLTNNFVVTKIDDGPLNDGASETINVSSFRNVMDNQSNIIEVTTPMSFDSNTRIAYTVQNGVTVKLSLHFGARLDMVKVAQDSVKRALENKMRQPQTTAAIRQPLVNAEQVQQQLKRLGLLPKSK